MSDADNLRPLLIGVAGGTCSGRTTVSERLAELAGDEHLALIKLDSYYVSRQAAPGATWRRLRIVATLAASATASATGRHQHPAALIASRERTSRKTAPPRARKTHHSPATQSPSSVSDARNVRWSNCSTHRCSPMPDLNASKDREEPGVGIEPTTTALQVRCSAN